MIYQVKALVLLFGVSNVSGMKRPGSYTRRKPLMDSAGNEVVVLDPRADGKVGGGSSPTAGAGSGSVASLSDMTAEFSKDRRGFAYKGLPKYIDASTSLICKPTVDNERLTVTAYYCADKGDIMETLGSGEESDLRKSIEDMVIKYDLNFNYEGIPIHKEVESRQLESLPKDELKKVLGKTLEELCQKVKAHRDISKDYEEIEIACSLDIELKEELTLLDVAYITVTPRFNGKNMSAWLLLLVVKYLQNTLKRIECEAQQMGERLRPPHVYYVAKLGFKLKETGDELSYSLKTMMDTTWRNSATKWLKCLANRPVGRDDDGNLKYGRCMCGWIHTKEMKKLTRQYQLNNYRINDAVWMPLPMELSVKKFISNSKPLRSPENRDNRIKIRDFLKNTTYLNFTPNKPTDL